MRNRVLALAAVMLLALALGIGLRSRRAVDAADGTAEKRNSAGTVPAPDGVPAGGSARDVKPAPTRPDPAGTARSLRISGRVLKHDGSPAVGCPVRLRMPAEDKTARATTSASGGAFQFDSLGAERGVLVAGEVWRAGELGQVSCSVDLSAGQDLQEVVLKLPEARLITVTVVDARGAALAGAWVALPWEAENEEAAKHGYVPTDERGVARLTSYSEYPVVAVAEAPADGHPYLLPPEVMVEPGEDAVRFVLEDAGVAGGVVLAPWGTPLPGLKVVALPEQGRPGDAVSRATTGGDGRFEINLPSGKPVVLEIDFGETEPVVREAKDSTPVRVIGSLAGVRAGDRDLVLQLRPEPLDRTLRVRVESPSGGPVANAPVRLFERFEDPLAARVTNAVGLAEFPGLPARKLLVEVSPPEGDPAAGDWTKGVVRNVVPEGQELVVRLRAGFRISGVVVGPDGAPCAGAQVCTLIKRPDSGIVTVGADGRFSLLFDAEDQDRLDLVAWGEADGRKLNAELRLRDRSVREVTIRLKETE